MVRLYAATPAQGPTHLPSPGYPLLSGVGFGHWYFYWAEFLFTVFFTDSVMLNSKAGVPPTCSNVNAVTKKVDLNLNKNKVDYRIIYTDVAVGYTFSGRILMQAVVGGDTDHGSKQVLCSLTSARSLPLNFSHTAS